MERVLLNRSDDELASGLCGTEPGRRWLEAQSSKPEAERSSLIRAKTIEMYVYHQHTFIHNYTVPLKLGRQIRTEVVNPVHARDGPRLKELYDAAFGDTTQLDVWLKRENTLRMINDAAKAEDASIGLFNL